MTGHEFASLPSSFSPTLAQGMTNGAFGLVLQTRASRIRGGWSWERVWRGTEAATSRMETHSSEHGMPCWCHTSHPMSERH